MLISRPPAEVEIDDALVRRLVAAQFPQWTDLPVQAVPSAGWDNVIYRLGTDLAARLPRRRIGAQQVSREHRWLPALAGRLPLTIPVVVGEGRPAAGYPWRWSVVSWLPGEIAAASRDLDLAAAARSTALPTDDATWERGRGWALLHGLRCAACSVDNPLLGEIGSYTLSQLITSYRD